MFQLELFGDFRTGVCLAPTEGSMDFSPAERRQLDWSARRGVPFGDETWVESVAKKYDLESTMRPRGRPKKFRPAEKNP